MRCVECGRRWDDVQRTGRPRRYCSRSCQARAYRRRRDEGRLSATGRSAPAARESSATLQAAIALADVHGIVAVTLRSVADRSESTHAAAQRELGSRDRLVSRMVHHVLARHATTPPRREAPAEALARLAESEWRAYREHPWLVDVLASTRPPLVPAVLDASRAAVEAFVEIGLDTDAAFTRYLAFSAYIQGMALLLRTEQQESDLSGTSYRAWWAEEVRRLDRSGARRRHPWLNELGAGRETDSFDADTAFSEGLRVVLRGLTCVVPDAPLDPLSTDP